MALMNDFDSEIADKYFIIANIIYYWLHLIQFIIHYRENNAKSIVLNKIQYSYSAFKFTFKRLSFRICNSRRFIW